MRSGSKWIESRPDDRSSQVARRALRSRLVGMWEYLVASVEGPLRETENVHQLRVFSRRAAATLEIFDDCVPGRRGRWVAKQVKRVRKASGEARDFDVLLLRWTDRLEQVPSGEAALLVDELKSRRAQAQTPVEKVYAKLIRKRFAERVGKLARRIRDRGVGGTCDQPFACMARQSLVRLVVPYLAAGEAALVEPEKLHAFRIQGKQVRYAMEIFAGVFDEDFREELYPVVEALQDRLGSINDHVTAKSYFAAWHAESESCATRHALEYAMEYEQSAFESSRQEFLDWFSIQRREDLRRRFARYVDLESRDEPKAGCEPGGEQ